MKKRVILITTILLLCVITSACSYNVSPAATNIVFDAPSFSRITSEALISTFGEPDSRDEWTNQTSNGEFNMTTYYYQKENTYFEFVVCDDTVVRVHFFPNTPVGYQGKVENIFKLFGIEPGSSITKTADTGVTLRYQSVSDTVGGIDIYDVSKNDKTFGYAYITYNWNYFE